MVLLDIAKSYAASDGGRVILLHHFVLALALGESLAGRLLADSGFSSPEPVPSEYQGADSFRVAPELARNLDWADGLRLGLGSEPDFGACFLTASLVGPSSLEQWLRGSGADCDRLCQALTRTLDLPESLCAARVRWSGESLRLGREEGEALIREYRSQGRRFMINTGEDGAMTIIPEEL